jgi:aldose sugar dehydrogenase
LPDWRGNLFAGALAGQHLRRMVLKNDQVVSQEVLLKDQLGRIRDVVSSPDGYLWFITDAADGGLYRLEPADPN